MGLLDTGQYVRPGQYQRPSLLDPNVMNLIQSGGPRVAPAPAAAPVQPARRGPGFLTYLMEGREGMDRERARLEAEANRPQMEARRARLRQAAEAMGPAAMLAFDLNPEKFGENLAEQYSPQVIAAGNLGCMMQIGSGTGIPVVHTVELLDWATGGPQPRALVSKGS